MDTTEGMMNKAELLKETEARMHRLHEKMERRRRRVHVMTAAPRFDWVGVMMLAEEAVTAEKHLAKVMEEWDALANGEGA